MNFAVIDEVGAHALNVRRRGAIEVGGAQSCTEVMRLDLKRTASMRYQSTTERNYTDHAECCSLRVGGSIGLRVLVVVVSIAIAGDDDNPEDFRQQHGTGRRKDVR